MADYFREAGRVTEIVVGLFSLAASAIGILFGIFGFIDFAHGSHAAGANPLWCGFEIVLALWLAYHGIRMVVGSYTGAALLSNTMLLACGLALAGAAAFLVWYSHDRHKAVSSRDVLYALTLGIAALALWWRRVHRDAV